MRKGKKKNRANAQTVDESVVREIKEYRPDLSGLIRFIPPSWGVEVGDRIYDLVVEGNRDCIKVLMIISKSKGARKGGG